MCYLILILINNYLNIMIFCHIDKNNFLNDKMQNIIKIQQPCKIYKLDIYETYYSFKLKFMILTNSYIKYFKNYLRKFIIFQIN